MIKSEDHDFFQPCLTYSKLEQVSSDGVATEVNLISQNYNIKYISACLENIPIFRLYSISI